MEDRPSGSTQEPRQTVTRRRLLAGAGAAGVGVVGAGILASCSPSAPAAPSASAAISVAPVPSATSAAAATSKDMKQVGFNDLQSRSAYEPTIAKYPNGRYILFVGHHTLDVDPVTKAPLPSRNPLTGKDEENGTSLIDVTDPANPKTLFHIAVPDGKGGGAQMVRAVDGNGLPAKDGKVYML